MNFRQANTVCRALCREFGIKKPPRVTRLQFPRCFVKDHIFNPDIGLRARGHNDHFHNEIEINQQYIHYDKRSDIVSTIRHELIHVKCYEKYPDYDGAHDSRFKEEGCRLGLTEWELKAIK